MEKVNGHKVNAVLLMKDKEKSQLTVNISVESFEETKEHVRITTKDIIPYLLNEKGIEIKSCIQSSVISNTSDDSLFGSWVFELPAELKLPIVDLTEVEPVHPVFSDAVLLPQETLKELIPGDEVDKPTMITRRKKAPKKEE